MSPPLPLHTHTMTPTPDPAWITESFYGCVALLRWAAAKLHITYEAINIYLFVIAWPLLSLASLLGHWWQWQRLRARRAMVD